MIDERQVKHELKAERLRKDGKLYIKKSDNMPTDTYSDLILAHKYMIKGLKKIKKSLKYSVKHVAKYEE